MAITDGSISGPAVGGGTPTGIVDFRPRRRAQGPRGDIQASGAGRNRQVISQAGGNFPGTASREAARRAAPARARTRPVPSARGAGAAPRAPRAGAGGGGGGALRVPTAVPTRVPRPTNVIQQGPRRAPSPSDARQLIREETERRDRIRKGAGFRAAQALRNR